MSTVPFPLTLVLASSVPLEAELPAEEGDTGIDDRLAAVASDAAARIEAEIMAAAKAGGASGVGAEQHQIGTTLGEGGRHARQRLVGAGG